MKVIGILPLMTSMTPGAGAAITHMHDIEAGAAE